MGKVLRSRFVRLTDCRSWKGLGSGKPSRAPRDMSSEELLALQGKTGTRQEVIEAMKVAASRNLLDASGKARLAKLLAENKASRIQLSFPGAKGMPKPGVPVGMDGKPIPEERKMPAWREHFERSADKLSSVKRALLSGDLPPGSIRSRKDWEAARARFGKGGAA